MPLYTNLFNAQINTQNLLTACYKLLNNANPIIRANAEAITQFASKVLPSTRGLDLPYNRKLACTFITLLFLSIIDSGYGAPLQANNNSIAFHKGFPDGGTNYCEGHLSNCLQGFATSIEGDILLAQISRILTDTTGDASAGTLLALKECTDTDALQGLVQNLVDKLGIEAFGGQLSCQMFTSPWHKISMTGTMFGLTDSDNCGQIQSDFAELFTRCQTAKTWLTGAALDGIIIASVVVFCCLCVGIGVCCKNLAKRRGYGNIDENDVTCLASCGGFLGLCAASVCSALLKN
jgi:hypothetical protein